ncbi:MAG: class I SAM-dependent methyltransferase [bacterium]
MACCQCTGIETLFDEAYVAKELKQYQKKGPDKTTRMLLEAVEEYDVAGMSVLDIGGGLGVIQHELLNAGASAAVSVEASSAYLEAARKEARRLGLSGQIRFLHGDFVALAEKLEPTEIVTLDRVICCYPDMATQVRLSAERAHKLYGLVYPRDLWWIRLVFAVKNLVFKIVRNPFRIFVHRTREVDAAVRLTGLVPVSHQKTAIWQVVLYHRAEKS